MTTETPEKKGWWAWLDLKTILTLILLGVGLVSSWNIYTNQIKNLQDITQDSKLDRMQLNGRMIILERTTDRLDERLKAVERAIQTTPHYTPTKEEN